MMMLGLYDGPPSSGGNLLLNASPFVQDGALFSTNEHGFEALPATIRRRLVDAFRFYDQPGLIYVGLAWNGAIAWEGRLEDPAVYAGAGGSGLSIQALGAWRALTDDRYTALWSSTSVADFRPFTETEIATSTPQRYTFDTQNRIFITPNKNATLGTTGAAKQAYIGYLAPDQGTRSIIGCQFSARLVAPAANWRGAMFAHNADFSINSTPWLFAAAGAGTTDRAVHVTFTGVPIISFFMDFNAADAVYAGETGANFLRITNLRFVTSTTNEISTTLTANRAAGAGVTATVGSTVGMYAGMQLVINSAGNPSEILTVTSVTNATQFVATFANAYVIGNAVQGFRVLADEIVKDIVAQICTLNSAQLSSSIALVQSPGLDLTEESYEDQVPADVLTHLTSLGDNQTPPRQWEVGVYEGRMLFFRPRGDAARSWYVDVTDLGIARTLEDLANSVYAIYQDAKGRTLRTAANTDGASISRYGITRREGVSTNSTSVVQRQAQRDAELADRKDPLPRATVAFDAIYDAAGARWPLWMARGGDTITVRNLPPSTSTTIDRVRTFRISHTTYNPMDRTLEIELEVPPPRLATLLARQAEGIRQERN